MKFKKGDLVKIPDQAWSYVSRTYCGKYYQNRTSRTFLNPKKLAIFIELEQTDLTKGAFVIWQNNQFYIVCQGFTTGFKKIK